MDRDMCEGNRKETLNVPSLVDLCVQTAIDNVEYLGDVGETDVELLERILPHCSIDQLKYIEDSTEGRDLSPVTDNLWKKFYVMIFGEKTFNTVVHRMNSRNVTFKWKQLYEAKLKDVEEVHEKSRKRMKRLHRNEDARQAG